MLSTLRTVSFRAARQMPAARSITSLTSGLRKMQLGRAGCCVHSNCSCRNFSSAAAKKLQTGLAQELEHEKTNYEKPAELSSVPEGWTFTDESGNVNMKLEKELSGDRVCKVEWQLVSPPMAFDEEGEYPEGEGPEDTSEVELSVTVESKDGAQGLTYYCSTSAMEGAKDAPKTQLTIGNVKTWASTEERDNAAAYNGPEFDDLDDKLQESMEEYLAEIGVNEEVQSFINASASDKEQREYMRWMENLSKMIKA